MTPFQTTWRERVLGHLTKLGVADVEQKQKRVDFEEGEPEVQLMLRFSMDEDDYEVWLYPDEAAVAEPDDEWWSFDLDEHETPDKLGAALLEHLDDVVAGYRE